MMRSVPTVTTGLPIIWSKKKKNGNASGNAVASQNGNNTGTQLADPASKDENTREQSDKNIDKFNRLVVYDEEEVRKTKYNSEIRGRVQDAMCVWIWNRCLS